MSYSPSNFGQAPQMHPYYQPGYEYETQTPGPRPMFQPQLPMNYPAVAAPGPLSMDFYQPPCGPVCPQPSYSPAPCPVAAPYIQPSLFPPAQLNRMAPAAGMEKLNEQQLWGNLNNLATRGNYLASYQPRLQADLNPGYMGLHSPATLEKDRRIHDTVVDTKTHLKELEYHHNISWTERLFKGVKEFVWDDFGKHKAMSAGAVILGWYLFNHLKGTRAGSAIAWAAGLSIGYHFLRDKMGIRPGEKLASTVGLFSPKAEDVVRGVFDTAERVVMGPEGAGSAAGYFFDELNIKAQSNEGIMLTAMMQTSVPEFMNWYAAASRGLVSDIPQSVKGYINKVDSFSYLQNLPREMKMKLLLDVSRRAFTYLGKGNIEQGEAAVSGRLLTGQYSNDQLQPLQNKIQAALTVTESSGERKQLTSLLTNVRQVQSALQDQIQRNSGSFSMLDGMIVSLDAEKVNEMLQYDGLGKSVKETLADSKYLAKRAFQGIDYYGNATLDFLGEKTKLLSSKVSALLVKHNLTKADWKEWYYGTFKPWAIAAKDKGKGAVSDIAKGSVGHLMASTFNFGKKGTGRAVEISADGIDSLAAKMDGLAEAMDAATDSMDETATS